MRVYGHHWRKVRLVVLERDGGLCQIRGDGCEVEAGEVDHIVRPADGGAYYDPENLRAACTHCNRSRGAKVATPRRGRRFTSRDW